MQTVSQVVSEVQLTFPDANAHVVLDCVNRVHRDLCSEFSLFKSTSQIPLVSGQREYPISGSAMAVRAVTYLPDSTGAYEILVPTDVADLDRENARWRRLPPGRPRAFYLDAGNIGVVPAPDTTAVGGYPCIEVETVDATVLDMDDDVPSAIRSSRVYTLGARRYYAEMRSPEMVPLMDQLYQRELSDLERILGRRNRNYRPKITPSTGFIASQI